MHEFDICYKEVGDRKLLIDILRPEKEEGKFPVVFYIHGGAWAWGSRQMLGNNLEHIANGLLENGIAVVCIQYRFCNRIFKQISRVLKLFKKKPIKGDHGPVNNRYPMPVVDSVDAIRFAVKNADKFNLDTDRMAIFGASAGANMSLLAALCPEKFTENNDLKDITFKFKCIGDICGPVDLDPKLPEYRKSLEGKMMIRNYLGKWSISLNIKKLRESSPINYVRENLPPIGIFHSLQDELVPLANPHRIAKAWAEKGNIVEETYVSGYDHSFDKRKDMEQSEPFPVIAKKVCDFIIKYI